MREDLRKIQLVGGATYTVSIPKKWIKELDLKPGDVVLLTMNDDGTIVISPKEIRETKKEIVLHINENTPVAFAVREFLSYYVLGYNVIKMIFSGNTLEHRLTIRKVIKEKLIGMELISETGNEMVVQSLVKKAEITIPKAIERLGIIVLFMLEDAFQALREANKKLAESVIERDDDVDRLYFFLVRNLMLLASKPYLISEYGLSSLEECIGYRLISKSIERAGDHAARIAYLILEADESICDGEVCNELENMKDTAKKVFELALTALKEKDVSKANEVYQHIDKIHKLEKEILLKMAKRDSFDKMMRLRLVIESIKRFAEYGDEVADFALLLGLKNKRDISKIR